MHTDGTGFTWLTGGLANDVEPAWSPDGTRIAFVRDGSVRVQRLSDGEPARIGTGTSDRVPAWSPDAALLGFSRGGAIVLALPDGAAAGRPDRRLEHRPCVLAGRPAPCVHRGRDLCTTGLDGADPRRVTFEAGNVTYDGAGAPPDWRPAAAPATTGRAPYTCGTPSSDIVLTVRTAPARVHVGESFAVAAAALNAGPDPIVRLPLDALLPSNAKPLLARLTRGGCHFEARLAVCSLSGALLPGAQVTLRIEARATEPGPLRTFVEFPQGPDASDPRHENDRVVATGTVAGCTLTGTDGADVLAGTAHRDVVCGADGNDTITGGAGPDSIYAGDGDDVVLARDGRGDRVSCGPGRDRVRADRIDALGGCEVRT